ncbi:hypothetical protein BH23PAT1_BH23PAT1_0150 [soil metagenome]
MTAVEETLLDRGPLPLAIKILEGYEDTWGEAKYDIEGCQPLVNRLQELLSPESSRIIDLGSGIGEVSLALAKAGYNVTAVDGTKTAIARLTEMADRMGLNVDARTGDVRTALQEGASYDGLVNMFLMHHLLNSDALELQKQMRDKTTPGGVNVFAVYGQDGYFYRNNPDTDDFFPSSIEQLLQPYVGEGWAVLNQGQAVVPIPGSEAIGEEATNQVLRCMVQKPISNS